MCGIAGYWDLTGSVGDQALIGRMCDAIISRGPDGVGYYNNHDVGLFLGHRRLAILELSEAGKQPMFSSCGRYVIVFNGEIYNHLALRQQLESSGCEVNWKGHSDTETLLACISHWGLERALSKLVGMFAFAVWDAKLRQLTLVRDRLGEKPLYFGWQNNVLFFASELKAIEAYSGFNAEIDRNSLSLLLRHNCIPAPYSIFKNIFKLMPGHYLTIPIGRFAQVDQGESVAYWSVNGVVERGLSAQFSGSADEAVELLHSQLLSTISDQMLSDVPLGAFLSGGIDSTTIVALMQAQRERAVKTFTIGFNDDVYDEAVHAKAIARHLGTDHTELYVSPSDALDVIQKLPSIYCEPFSDSSQIPTFLVSKLARQHVTVALSGDGGDELFGGYNRYLTARKAWSLVSKFPAPLRRFIATALFSLPPQAWGKFYDFLEPLLPKKLHFSTPGEKIHKLAGVISAGSEYAFFLYLTSHWQQPSDVVIGSKEPPTLLSTRASWPRVDSFEHWMMAMDAKTYMPNDILVKVDRAAMAASLETRVPFLDHRIFELAWSMPLEFKIREGKGKWLLRQVLNKYVPDSLIDRPKMGFGVPIDSWLRTSLRDWAEDLLCEARLTNDGFFDPKVVRQAWSDHLSGRRNLQHQLWDILMFQAWVSDRR